MVLGVIEDGPFPNGLKVQVYNESLTLALLFSPHNFCYQEDLP